MRIVLSVFVIFPLVLGSCRNMQGASPVNVGQLADAYVELLVLNERYSLANDSLASQRYVTEYEQILRSHNLTKAEYASQFETAAGNPSLYREMCDRALKKLQAMRAAPDTTRRPLRSLQAL